LSGTKRGYKKLETMGKKKGGIPGGRGVRSESHKGGEKPVCLIEER